MPADLPLTATVRATREQVSCDLAEEIVVLSLADGAYYGLNPVAARIWELIQEPRSIRDIRDRLLEEYAVEPDRCTRDLEEVLELLLEWKLAEVRDPDGGRS